MKKYLMGITLTAALASPLCHADTVFGFYFGAGSWDTDFTGDFNSEDGSNIDVENTLNLGADNSTVYYIAIEHPVPLVPNMKLQTTDVVFSKNTRLDSEVTFDDRVYSANTRVKSTFDLTHTDATFYYELLDNWVSLDLGFTIRMFGGEADLRSSTQHSRVELEAVLPMLYAMTKFELPFTGAYVGGEVNAVGYSGNTLSDLTLRAGYESPIGLGAEVGYRTLAVELDEEDELTTDLKTAGAYASITYHF